MYVFDIDFAFIFMVPVILINIKIITTDKFNINSMTVIYLDDSATVMSCFNTSKRLL